jgi:hypothetical protein
MASTMSTTPTAALGTGYAHHGAQRQSNQKLLHQFNPFTQSTCFKTWTTSTRSF